MHLCLPRMISIDICLSSIIINTSFPLTDVPIWITYYMVIPQHCVLQDIVANADQDFLNVWRAFCLTSHLPMKSFQVSLMSYCEQTSTLSTPTGSYSSDITVLRNSCTINFLCPCFPSSSKFNIQGTRTFDLTLCLCVPPPSTTLPCGSRYLKNTWPAVWGNMIGTNILEDTGRKCTK